MELSAKIYVAGHRGLIGSASVKRLRASGYTNLLLRSHTEPNLMDHVAVDGFFDHEWPDYIFLAAAKVGEIFANSTYPADFIRINLTIAMNVIDVAHRYGSKYLLFLGPGCIYPRDCPQPIKKEYLLSGPLNSTNSPYAVTKIAGH